MYINYLLVLIFLIGQLSYVAIGQEGVTCTDSYCTAIVKNCPEFHCKGPDMRVYKNATICGCCHLCVKELDEGEVCSPDRSGIIPETMCKPHLKCNKETTNKKISYICKKISDIDPNGCEAARVNISTNMNELAAGPPVPECDEFGEYSSVQCKNGTICYCVDKNGNRIFGSATYDKIDDMNCLCSRQFNQLNRELAEHQFSIDPVFFMRCKANGNYEPFQATNNFTYCVNTTDGILHERAVSKQNTDQLPCAHESYSYNTDCIKRYFEAIKNIELLEDEEYMVVGYDVPKCDLDGNYAPVQCLNDHCYCVNKKGEKIHDTQVARTDIDYAYSQTCSCVRDKELFKDIPDESRDKVTEMFSEYICDKNGNYLPLQCSESFCYCVDRQNGYINSTFLLKTAGEDIRKLDCYINYPTETHHDQSYLELVYDNEF
ncbi:thyroglobulin-like [Oppia nitens]|uniref:thyroglobulin-like n=1 Tax=Oppia nitens TaxID=1686743 RepID=UPI0023DBD3BE|nr:thyroglobulin-like [Oppia nitens]